MTEKHTNDPNKKREGPRLSFEFEGTRFELRPDNSHVYLHEEDRYDHIFFKHEADWYRMFRAQMANFDSIAEFMEINGYPVHVQDAPMQQDFEAYHKAYGWDPLPELEPITPRREKQIQFGMYILDHVQSVEDLWA